MKERNLPVGTVCVLGNKQTVMIIGYYSSKYENEIKTFDYEAIKYPEGTLSNQRFYFNHNEIIDVVFTGYKNAEYRQMIQNFQGNDTNYHFNSNGQVIADKNALKETYQFDNQGKVISDSKESARENKSGYKFDSKGRVTADENTLKEAYQFDDQGKVISNSKESIKENKPEYKFDSNGHVIEEENQTENPAEPVFHFDENGIVILDSSVPTIDQSEKSTHTQEIKNPFMISQKAAKKVDSNAEKWPIFKTVKFNSEGVVLETEEFDRTTSMANQ